SHEGGRGHRSERPPLIHPHSATTKTPGVRINPPPELDRPIIRTSVRRQRRNEPIQRRGENNFTPPSDIPQCPLAHVGEVLITHAQQIIDRESPSLARARTISYTGCLLVPA